MLVDLFTPDRKLEDLMLTEYPGRIFENQISNIHKSERKIYCFSGLKYEKLMKFLINYLDCKFKIRKHSNRNLINPYLYH